MRFSRKTAQQIEANRALTYGRQHANKVSVGAYRESKGNAPTKACPSIIRRWKVSGGGAGNDRAPPPTRFCRKETYKNVKM